MNRMGIAEPEKRVFWTRQAAAVEDELQENGIYRAKKEYIEKMKKNQLTRAIRVDKFTVTALELILMEYLSEERAQETIPVLKMIRTPQNILFRRAQKLSGMIWEKVSAAGIEVEIEVEEILSQVGGGSLPGEYLPSAAVSLRPCGMSSAHLEEVLRKASCPIIVRTFDDAVKMDVRTIFDEEFDIIADTLAEVLA